MGSTTATDVSEAPPEVLGLAGHPIRWLLLRELARSDRRVGELSALTGQGQSLVSYHLAQLRGGGLVTMRRSSADARDTYYCLDLTACADRLAEAGFRLHPGLQLPLAVPRQPSGRPRPRGRGPVRVLFLCTGNSSRSPMAAGILSRMSAAAATSVVARSAGSEPRPVHPDAVSAMRERGVDISGHRPQNLAPLTRRRWDHVISLCDRLRERCPDFPAATAVAHWSIPDPAATTEHSRGHSAFVAVADVLTTRIGYLLATIQHTTTSAKG